MEYYTARIMNNLQPQGAAEMELTILSEKGSDAPKR